MTSPIVSTRDDVEVLLYAKDWTPYGRVDQFDGFKLKQHELGIMSLSITVPLEDLVELGAYSTLSQNTLVEVYIRGSLEFTGIVVVAEEVDREPATSPWEEPVIDVAIEALVDWQWHLMGREVKGDGGDRWSATGTLKPPEIMRDLIRANATTGYVVTPPGYATLGTSGADRTNFGGHAVDASASGSHPTTLARQRIDHGESLFHAIAEGCRQHDCTVTSSWNKAASPPLLTVNIGYPRTGTDRTTGSGRVVFDRETGTLVELKRSIDRGAEANVAEVHGQGTRTNQAKGLAIHQASYDTNGLRETGDLWPSARADEAGKEAEFVMAQIGGCETVYRAKIRESAQLVYGTHFGLGDKVVIYDSKRGVTVQDYVTEVEWSLSGQGPLQLAMTLGRPEQNDASKGGRSGGGGGRGGAGRKGGKPREKSGEPDAFRTITAEDGSVAADEVEDDLLVQGEQSVQRIRNRTSATTDGTGENTQEVLTVYVEGDYQTPCPSCTGYVLVYAQNLGTNVALLASTSYGVDPDPNPGGGG